MMTVSKSVRRSPSSFSIACDWSSSDGFGGIGPLVSTLSPVALVVLERVVERDPADQHAGGADRAVEPEAVGHQGPAQVALDQATRLPARASVTARLIAVVVLPSPGSELVITKLVVAVDLDVLHVGAQHPERLGPRGRGVQHLGGGPSHGAAVGEDAADDGGVGDLADVVGGGHRGVEQVADHRGGDAEQQPEQGRQGEVADRLGGDRRGGVRASSTIEALIGAFWTPRASRGRRPGRSAPRRTPGRCRGPAPGRGRWR